MSVKDYSVSVRMHVETSNPSVAPVPAANYSEPQVLQIASYEFL